jgi:hypothetical protein
VVLGPLLDLPGVRDAVEQARAAVDRVHKHPANRRGWPTTAAEASIRAARASAALDGGSTRSPFYAVAPSPPAQASPPPTATHDPQGAPTEDSAEGDAGLVEAAAVTDPVLAGAIRAAEAIGQLLGTWQRAPLQALARLHVLAAAGLVGEEAALGRPVPDRGVSARLQLLASTVADPGPIPGLVLAAVVHGELLALAPFECANGVVARAASRLTAISTGFDPKGLTLPEVGHLKRATEYRAAADGFATGEPAAVAAWLHHCCQAWQIGAAEALTIADATAS